MTSVLRVSWISDHCESREGWVFVLKSGLLHVIEVCWSVLHSVMSKMAVVIQLSKGVELDWSLIEWVSLVMDAYGCGSSDDGCYCECSRHLSDWVALFCFVLIKLRANRFAYKAQFSIL